MILALFLSLVVQLKTPTAPAPDFPIEGSKVIRVTKIPADQTPTKFVVDSVKDLEKIVAAKQRETELRKFVSTILDLDRLGQQAMITHWDTLGKTAKGRKQREQYMSLFKKLVEENYMEQARKYIGGSYVMTLTGEQKDAEGNQAVNGRIKKTDVDVLVEFDLLPEKNSYRIVDIKLDETSLEATYRSSFNRIIKKKGGLDLGFPELLSTMNKRLAELKKGKATQF